MKVTARIDNIRFLLMVFMVTTRLENLCCRYGVFTLYSLFVDLFYARVSGLEERQLDPRPGV